MNPVSTPVAVATRPRTTLARKFFLLLFGFIALLLFQLGLGIYATVSVDRQRELVSAVNEQRLHAWALGQLAGAVLDARSGRGAERTTLRESVALYETRLRLIDDMLIARGGDFDYSPLAREVRAAWHEHLRPLLEVVLDERSTAAPTALAGYRDRVPDHVERLSRIARIAEARGEHDARRLAIAQAAIVGLSLLLAVAGMMLVRYVVVRPLRRFIEATRAIADGAYDRQMEIVSSDELGVLARTYNRMALAIDDKTTRLHAFNEVALAVTSSLSMPEILDRLMRHGMPLVGASGVCIVFYDAAIQRFYGQVARGLSEAYLAQLTFPPGGMADTVLHGDDIVLANDRARSRYPLSPAARAEGVRSIICLALASGEHRLGAIYFYRRDRDEFEFEEIELIRTFASLAAHAIRNARLHASTVDLAQTDELTGLANRRRFMRRLHEELVRAQRTQKPVSVLMLDLDRFKGINDNHGHAAGDAVLRAAAGVFRHEVRDDIDIAARTGGEEFMVLLPETDGERAVRVAERIREAVAAIAVSLPDGGVLGVTVSIGVACYPRDAVDERKLLANVDRALYAAKTAGRNRVVSFPG